MKHTFKVTLLLLSFFVFSQIFGLFIISADMDIDQDEEGNNINVTYADTIMGERPDMEPKDSFISIVLAIGIGTLLALILIKLNLTLIWNIWFFLAVFISISVSLGVFLPTRIAFLLSFILTLLKNIKSNLLTHNISELLIYPGISLIFAPLLNLFWIIILLFIISFYDMYAVWKSKHMVKLAEFQSNSNKFAGFMIKYKEDKKTTKVSEKSTKTKTKSSRVKKSSGLKRAVLGGGDVFFPLLFSGILIQHLILVDQLTKWISFAFSLIVVATTTLALMLLFYYSKKNRYYPAMPFISGGCFAGLIIVKGIVFFL
ncbi:hypothetical protein KY321_00840 [Candidatus Woesearchaeota archaeon]|nr:hypothetical protein [Candidatus Woesearchaeota archaeon]